MKQINFNFLNKKCKILIGNKLIKQIGSFISNEVKNCCCVVVISDKKTHKLYGKIIKNNLFSAGFKVLEFVIGRGEKFKNFNVFLKICNFLSENHVTKTDIIIALGGGVVCDLAGFVSSCFLRGLELVQIPTTLLAMVDASVGGKNAINLKFGKNLIGSFKQPVLVLCDVNLILTQSKLEFFNGMAEVVKYAALFSEIFFQILSKSKAVFNLNEIENIVFRCLTFKKQIVEIDEFDKLGERTKLNFGHTIGHALEAYYGYKKIKHGQAISIGMCFCLQQAEQWGLTKSGECLKLKAVLNKFNLPTQLNIPIEKIYKFCLNDKKIYSNGINLTLLKKIGSCYVKRFSLNEFEKFIGL